MPRFKILITTLTCFLLSPGVQAEKERYVFNDLMDHGDQSCLNFLIGNWVSKDKTTNFSESWSRTADGQLIGIRKFGTAPEFDMFSAFGTNSGLAVIMKRTTQFRCQSLTGNARSRTTNRAFIECTTDQKSTIKSTNSYDSPSDGQLVVTVELSMKDAVADNITGQNKGFKNVYFLQREGQ